MPKLEPPTDSAGFGAMIFDLLSWGDGKSKITIEEAHAPEFTNHRHLMILEIPSLFGIKSKITTMDLVQEQTGYLSCTYPGRQRDRR